MRAEGRGPRAESGRTRSERTSFEVNTHAEIGSPDEFSVETRSSSVPSLPFYSGENEPSSFPATQALAERARTPDRHTADLKEGKEVSE